MDGKDCTRDKKRKLENTWVWSSGYPVKKGWKKTNLKKFYEEKVCQKKKSWVRPKGKSPEGARNMHLPT